MGRPHLAVVGLALVLSGPRAGADSSKGSVAGKVTIERPEGATADDVVVYLVGFSEAPPRAQVTVQQHDRTFSPALVAITVGQTVSFPNGDPFLHNVFSSTPLRRFDLGSYPEGETRKRVFPSEGRVEVFCNIHPEMAATILVLPNRRFTLADAAGDFRIAGVPPGHWTLYAYSRRAAQPVGVEVDVARGAEATVDLTLTETAEPAPHKNKYGETYRDPGVYR